MRVLPVELLHRLFCLNGETGILFWRPRPLSDFAGEGWKQRKACATWNSRFAGKIAGRPADGEYISVAVDGVHYKAHRIVFAMANGRWPTLVIDHINGDRSDNRPENLRETTQKINSRNQKRRVRSSPLGHGIYVDPRTSLYVVAITDAGIKRHIGQYKDLREARIARAAAERALGYHSNHGRTA